MTNNENYETVPGESLEKVLEACQWLRLYGKERLWELGRSRILVDEIGIFLFREVELGWKRTAGLSHNRIRHLRKRILKFNEFTLDLITGE